MRKNEREKQLPSRSQGLIAESNEPRGTQGRPQQVISPQLDEDRGPPCSWAQVEPPGSPWGRGSCSAARARSPGCGADTSPGQGRWQKQDVQTDEGCRLWGGGQGVLCQGSHGTGMAPSSWCPLGPGAEESTRRVCPWRGARAWLGLVPKHQRAAMLGLAARGPLNPLGCTLGTHKG